MLWECFLERRGSDWKENEASYIVMSLLASKNYYEPRDGVPGSLEIAFKVWNGINSAVTLRFNLNFNVYLTNDVNLSHSPQLMHNSNVLLSLSSHHLIRAKFLMRFPFSSLKLFDVDESWEKYIHGLSFSIKSLRFQTASWWACHCLPTLSDYPILVSGLLFRRRFATASCDK